MARAVWRGLGPDSALNSKGNIRDSGRRPSQAETKALSCLCGPVFDGLFYTIEGPGEVFCAALTGAGDGATCRDG